MSLSMSSYFWLDFRFRQPLFSYYVLPGMRNGLDSPSFQIFRYQLVARGSHRHFFNIDQVGECEEIGS